MNAVRVPLLLTVMYGSKRMRAYAVQQTPLKKEARERKRGMYSTLLVCITNLCNTIISDISYNDPKKGKEKDRHGTPQHRLIVPISLLPR